ncbi:MAG: PaaI family thioesterase [Syntrophomonadaceae bacterium]|nr:PaaI family thioesterase [Syntrophomonadaceae bacterium]MDH7497064.1 PaaI family thioesterase [Syntrophomonadaceae bacterium]
MARYTDLEAVLARLGHEAEPPGCFAMMQPEFVEYAENEAVTFRYPVLETFANPRGSMQGGFICAAFDNAFGSLVYFATGSMAMASVDLHVNYQRPVLVGDTLTVTVQLKSLGRTIAHLTGDAFDGAGRLVATATTNIARLPSADSGRG